VIGRSFDVVPLAGMLGEDALPVLGQLEEALRAKVLAKVRDRPHAFRFVHALVRDLLYKRLTGAERLLAHRAAAEALAGAAPSTPHELARVAGHFTLAAAGGAGDRALHWSVRAAAAARDAGDVEAANDLLLGAARAAALCRVAEATSAQKTDALLVALAEDARLRAATEAVLARLV
jgi:hypothetical protein